MEKFRNMLLPAFTIALVGTLICFTGLTVMMAGTSLKQWFPLICVIFYALLSLVLDNVTSYK